VIIIISPLTILIHYGQKQEISQMSKTPLLTIVFHNRYLTANSKDYFLKYQSTYSITSVKANKIASNSFYHSKLSKR